MILCLKIDFPQGVLVVLVMRLGDYMNGKSTGVLIRRLHTTRSYNRGSVVSSMERSHHTHYTVNPEILAVI